jgi:MFS transporter, DHA1 family, quinolone resistance protein
MEGEAGERDAHHGMIKWLTYIMFMMFAMTTDSVGSVIPTLIKEFRLSMTAAGTFHYVPMAAIALGAILLGFLADKLGRQRTIVVGLVLYGVSSVLFAFGNTFLYFVMLLAVAGIGISVFKTGALALVGDITKSTTDHSSTMNMVEGFFGTGAIIGPAIVATLLSAGLSWKWLYVIAAGICGILIVVAVSVRYPATKKTVEQPSDLKHTLRVARNPYALAFSAMVMLYVAVEVAIYVWMPTYLLDYHGSTAWLPAYALTIFFVLRAMGRFAGAWLINQFAWTWILALFGTAIFLCFLGSLLGGALAGAYLLPLSGLFMSMIYPTLNSKGISCFHKAEHGAAAGVILFFTAAAAALGPLAMAAVSDHFGDAKYGFVLATAFSFLLLVGLLLNLALDPAKKRLQMLEKLEYPGTP